MLDKDTKQTIDNARDILVGKVPNPVTQIDLITTAMIYKFMDDMDLENISLGGKRVFFVGDLEQYAWSKLLSATVGNSERINLYTQALEKLPYAKQIPQLFRSIFKDAFLPFRDGATLTLFLKEIDSLSYADSENLGDGFEYLLSIMGVQKDAGQFRTPRHIIDFIVEVVNPTKNDSILDPACGTAGFLISAYKHIIKTANEQKKPLSVDAIKRIAQNITGYDIDPTMQKLSLVNLYLHKFATPKVYEYDTLTKEDRWGDKFDVILANPPFMTPKGGIRPHNKFGIKANKSEVLFVDYFMEHLTLNGRAGFVVPEGIIFQSATAYKSLRKMMVEDNYLYAVVSLPAGVFNPYAGVKTSILFFDRQLAKKMDKILFVEVKNDGFDLGAQRRAIKENDLPSALQAIQEYQKSYNKKDLKLPDNCLLVEKSKIAENGDYNLTASRYKQTDQVINSKWEMVNLGDVADVSSGDSAPQSADFFRNGIYPFCRTSDVGKVHISDNLVKISDYLNEEGIKGLTLFKKGTILLPKSGASTFLNHRAILGIDSYVSSHLATIAVHHNKILEKYLFFILLYIDTKTMTANSAYPSLKISEIKNIQIPLPPLEVQEEIVKELEGYQAIINGSQDVIDNWKPTFTVKPNWPKVKLSDVCKLIYGFTDSAKDTGDTRYIRITDIDNNGYLKGTDIKYVNKNAENTKYLLKKNDLVVARTGATFGKTLLYREDTPAIYASYLIKLDFDSSKVYNPYYWAFTSSSDYWKQANNLVSGGGQPQFNANAIQEILIPLPSIDEQKKIVEQIKREEEYINTCKEYVAHFKQKITDKIQSIWSSK